MSLHTFQIASSFGANDKLCRPQTIALLCSKQPLKKILFIKCKLFKFKFYVVVFFFCFCFVTYSATVSAALYEVDVHNRHTTEYLPELVFFTKNTSSLV